MIILPAVKTSCHLPQQRQLGDASLATARRKQKPVVCAVPGLYLVLTKTDQGERNWKVIQYLSVA